MHDLAYATARGCASWYTIASVELATASAETRASRQVRDFPALLHCRKMLLKLNSSLQHFASLAHGPPGQSTRHSCCTHSKSVRSQIMSSSSASLAPCSFLMESITLDRQHSMHKYITHIQPSQSMFIAFNAGPAPADGSLAEHMLRAWSSCSQTKQLKQLPRTLQTPDGICWLALQRRACCCCCCCVKSLPHCTCAPCLHCARG
jgi:hypothetical protein